MKTPGKRGQGMMLLLVVSAAAVLTIVGFRQMFSASTLTAQSVRSEAGGRAAALAESAVAEGLWQFQEQANDPASALFKELRRDVFAPAPGAIGLERDLELGTLPELLTREEGRGWSLQRFEAKVLYQRQFEDLPCERFGLVRFTARVCGLLAGVRASREVELARGFKVVLAGVPRPFDQCALYVAEGSTLTDLTGVNARRKRYVDETERLTGMLAAARRSAPAALVPRYERLMKTLLSRKQLETSVPELPIHPEAVLFATWRQRQFFPLENLDLDRRLEEDEKSFIPGAARQKSAEARVTSYGSDAAAHTEFLDASEASIANLSKLMGRIWAFHEGFRMVDSSEGAYSRIAGCQEQFGLAHWRRVCFFHLRSGERGRTAQQQFDALVHRLAPLSGIVLVENDREPPLRLPETLHGKLVVVVTGGGAALDNTNKADRAKDLLTVVALGGPVTVSGEVHAQVACFSPGESTGALCGPIVLEPGSTLRGALLLERLAPGSKLAGKLARAAKYFSGLTGPGADLSSFYDHYVVGVSPIDTYERMGRR